MSTPYQSGKVRVYPGVEQGAWCEPPCFLTNHHPIDSQVLDSPLREHKKQDPWPQGQRQWPISKYSL